MSARAVIYLAVAAVGLAIGCGGAPPPARDIRAEIASAEDAERARQHDVARTRYEQAVVDARDPASSGFARYRFGETLATWGEYAEAQRELEASVAAAPAEPAAWHDLGIVRQHAGDANGAVAAFQRAKTLAPTDWRPRLALAALHWSRAGACFREHALAPAAEPTAPTCAPELEASKAEYRELLALDLPERLRTKVQWALGQLDQPYGGLRAPAPPPSS